MYRFKKIYIEITDVCNLACSFCPGTLRPPVFMNPEAFARVLAGITGWTRHIYFHVMGEPLLHPDIGKLLDISGSGGFMVNLTTNGTLLGKAGPDILEKPSLRQVNISLHSHEANEGGCQVDDYLDGVIRFTRKAMEKGGPIISLRLWNTSEDGKNTNNEYLVRRLGDAFSPGLTLERIPPGGRGVKLAANLYLNTAAVFQWPGAGKKDLGGDGFCRGLRDQAAVLADGTVVPCCLDSEGNIRLGNIFEQEFGDIIGSERASGIYGGFSERRVVERLCRNCGYRTRFSIDDGHSVI